MALNRHVRAHCARHASIRTSLKLKCKTSKFNNTTAMPSIPRRIVCPTVVFRPTCCSNAPITRAPKAVTSFIRSITSRAKRRHCSTRDAGHATGSTRAVNVVNAVKSDAPVHEHEARHPEVEPSLVEALHHAQFDRGHDVAPANTECHGKSVIGIVE